MGRALVGGLIVALIAIAIGLLWYRQEHADQQRQAAQISDLTAQVGKLSSDDERLKSQLTKVQDEETRLTQENEILRKTLEEAKLTGKVKGIPLPYPPK